MILQLGVIPTPRRLDNAHHRLPAGMDMDMDMLYSDFLLALAAMAVQRFEERRIRVRKLIRLGEVLAPALESLLAVHGAAVALHRRVVCRNELRRHHASSSSFGPMPISAATAALNCVSRVSGSRIASFSRRGWPERRLMHFPRGWRI